MPFEVEAVITAVVATAVPFAIRVHIVAEHGEGVEAFERAGAAWVGGNTCMDRGA